MSCGCMNCQKYKQCPTDRVEHLEDVLSGLLSTISLDWYAQQFCKQPDYSHGQTGIVAKIHNKETIQRIKIALEKARMALQKNTP